MTYEYILINDFEVQRYLDQGWEPVPNVPHVVTNSSVSSHVKIFLRKAK